jgi:hypothetical protein
MQGPQCQHATRETAKFCEDCGARLLPLCVHCGHEGSPQAKSCEECGAPLIAPLSTLSSLQSRQREAESESRLYAYLFAVITVLQRESRVTYRRLKHLFRPLSVFRPVVPRPWRPETPDALP